jgi:DNA mismatch endonuclease (patch repair protein)
MDKLTAAARSANMRQIKSKGMKPELTVRSLAHRLGYRFRLHRKDLPGKPDLVFGPKKKAVFVHGCFWHGHEREDCLDGRAPKSNTSYWNPKLAGNKARDVRNVAALHSAGWKVLTIWECETKHYRSVAKRLANFLK